MCVPFEIARCFGGMSTGDLFFFFKAPNMPSRTLPSRRRMARRKEGRATKKSINPDRCVVFFFFGVFHTFLATSVQWMIFFRDAAKGTRTAGFVPEDVRVGSPVAQKNRQISWPLPALPCGESWCNLGHHIYKEMTIFYSSFSFKIGQPQECSQEKRER
nr:hypothetical protein [Pandoravirus massiliensis]